MKLICSIIALLVVSSLFACTEPPSPPEPLPPTSVPSSRPALPLTPSPAPAPSPTPTPVPTPSPTPTPAPTLAPTPSPDTTPPSVKDEAKGEKSEYIETVNQWSSYKDVASWMKENYAFDRRQMIIEREVSSRIQQADPEARKQIAKEAWSAPGIIQSAEETFGIKRGHCADAAQFAVDALNRINPEYNARFVFVTNSQGNPHHQVTGFTMNDEIYIMDFGAGPNWSTMKGVHGPYSTLSDYEEFLLSLDIKNFTLAGARWLPYGWPRD